MKSTVLLDDQLLEEARLVAAATGRSLSELIEAALRESLTRRSNYGDRKPVVLTTFKGEGLRPGVNLDDSAALRDLMDQQGAAN